MIEKPSIIIGGSLESLLYAWRTQTPILAKEIGYVFRHDKTYSSYDLSFMNAKDPKEFQKNLIFALSSTGLMPYASRISNIRQDAEIVDIFTEGNKKIQIKSQNIVKFDAHKEDYNVYDFFDMRAARSHDVTELVDEGNFAYQINFYNSPRTDHSTHNDLVAASKLTHKELLDPDYGQGICMIKVKRMLKSAGVTGHFAWERKGKKYYKQIKMEFYKREVSRVLETRYSFDQIYNMKQEEGKAWKTFETLKNRDLTL